jgi:hypothetical protein
MFIIVKSTKIKTDVFPDLTAPLGEANKNVQIKAIIQNYGKSYKRIRESPGS